MTTNNPLTEILALGKGKVKGSKNNSFYQKQRQSHLVEMSEHEESVVRLAVVSSDNCAVSILKDRLMLEADQTVLAAILTNPSLPKESIISFIETRAPHDPSCKFLVDEEDELGVSTLASIRARISSK